MCDVSPDQLVTSYNHRSRDFFNAFRSYALEFVVAQFIARCEGMKKAVFPCCAEENGFLTSTGKQAFVPSGFLIRSGGVYL